MGIGGVIEGGEWIVSERMEVFGWSWTAAFRRSVSSGRGGRITITAARAKNPKYRRDTKLYLVV